MQWRTPGKLVKHILIAGDAAPNVANIDEIMKVGVANIFGEVKPYFDAADLSIIQWETPLAKVEDTVPIAKSGPNLLCDPRGLEIMKYLGTDVALLANNHVGDQGAKAVYETIRIIEEAGIRTVGAGKDLADAIKPLCLDLDGLKLALINVAEHEFGTAERNAPGSAPLDPPVMLDQFRELKKQGYLVLALLHGGHECNPYPSPRMVKLFRMLADGGADAVFNCHTHCPEGVEVYGGRPIFYSPGNFYFPERKTPNNLLPTWYLGYMVRIGFDEAGAFEYELIPYRFELAKVTPLAGEEKERFMAYHAKLSKPIGDFPELERLFDLWTLPHGFRYVRGPLKRMHDAGFDFSDPEAAKLYLSLRNTYTCESHHDMVSNFYRMVEHGRVPAEPTLAEELAVLQQGPQR